VSERRVPYFERPAPPHDWRWKVALVGRTLIVLGLLMFGFVAYQLWGTGIQTAQAQHTLDRQFADQLAGTTSTSAPSTTSTTVPGSTTSTIDTTTSTTSTVPTAPAGPLPTNGSAVARLKIPSIGLTYTVVQGVGVADLKKGPGHFPETPMPGQYGNAAIAGHRTTYGHPFYKLDKVQVGDLIEVDTLVGTYTYRVTGSRVVSPAQYAEVIPTVDPKVATLTLATCTPAYTARQRLILFAQLVPEQSAKVFAPSTLGAPSGGLPGDGPNDTGATTTSTTAPAPSTTAASSTTSSTAGAVTTTTPTTIAPAKGSAANDAFASGWFDDGSAIPHVLLWGVLLGAVCLVAFRIGRRMNRLWMCFVVGAVPFLVMLYFFFENINRLLPSSI
jgi:sortase A